MGASDSGAASERGPRWLPGARRGGGPELLTDARSAPAVRIGTLAVLSLRAAYGLGLLLAPTKLAGGRWLGPGAGEPAAQVSLRGLGARELALHGIAIATYLRGGPVRPWLLASIAGDLADIAATSSSRRGLPQGSAPATAVVAGGSLSLSAALVALNPS